MNKDITLRPVQRTTIVESIVEQLLDQIRKQALQPGDRLPSERQLMQMLGVSRSSVREAIQGLTAMGLVESRRGAGIYVKQPKGKNNFNMSLELSPHALQKEMRQQLSDARFILETGIIREACAKITPERASMITEALNAYYPSSKSYPPDFLWETHDRIHLSFAQATGNQILVQMLHSLLKIVPESLREAGVWIGTPDEMQSQFQEDEQIHSELCKAIIRGDESSAREWMKRHAQLEQTVINRYYETTDESKKG